MGIRFCSIGAAPGPGYSEGEDDHPASAAARASMIAQRRSRGPLRQCRAGLPAASAAGR